MVKSYALLVKQGWGIATWLIINKKGVHCTPFLFCGADGARTRDLLRDRQAL